MTNYNSVFGTGRKAARNLLVIDPNVKEVDILLHELSRATEVVYLNTYQNPLFQIAQALVFHTRIETVHILAHGSPGMLHLGGVDVDEAYLRTQEGMLAAIETLLPDDASIALWACSVAWTPPGESFIRALAAATGAEIYATDRPVGAASLGGDWNIGVPAPFTETAQSSYPHTLPMFDFSSGSLSNGDTVYTETQDGVTMTVTFTGGTVIMSSVGGGGGSDGVFVFTPGGQSVTNVTFEFSENINIDSIQHIEIDNVATGNPKYQVTEGNLKSITFGVANFSEISGVQAFNPGSYFTDAGNLIVTMRDGGTFNPGFDNLVFNQYAPEFDDADDTVTLVLDENDGATTITGLEATDDNEGETLTWTVLSGPNKGSVTLTGTATATSGGGDLPGTYTYTPDADVSGSDSFTVQVSDGIDTDTLTVNVTITPDNIAPVITLPDAPGVIEDDEDVAIGDAIAIADEDDNDQTVTLTVTGGTVSLDGSDLSFSVGDGNDDAAVTFSGTLAEVNAALDSLTFTPTANAYGDGAASIRLQTADGAGGNDDDTLTIDITAVDDPMVITGDTSGNIDEDNTGTVTGTLNLSDPDGTESLSGFAYDGDYGRITTEYEGDWIYDLNESHADVQGLTEGETLTDVITIQTADGANQDITITINGADDPGSLSGFAGSVTVNEDEITLLDGDVTFTDIDSSGGTLTVSGLLSGDVVSLQDTGSGSGEVGFSGTSVTYEGVSVGTTSGGDGDTFSIALNANASDEVVDALIEALTFSATDDSPVEARTLTLNVADKDGNSVLGGGQVIERASGDNPFYDNTYSNQYTAPTMVDIDNDGDIDLFVGFGNAGAGIRFWENDGSGDFTEQTGANNPFNGVDFGTRAAPTFADIDGDGDKDAFVGINDGTVRFFENTGSAATPSFTERTDSDNPLNVLDVGSKAALAFGDLDNDGDLDAFAGQGDGSFTFFRNDGNDDNANFTEVSGSSNPLDGVDLSSTSSIELIDMDNDGDLDAVLGQNSGDISYFENTGSTNSASFTERTGDDNPLNDVSVYYISNVALGDIDGDSVYEAVVGAFSEDDLLTYDFTVGQSIDVAVTPVNDPSVITGTDARTINEGSTSISGDLISSDPDGDIYFTASVQDGDYGSLSINAFGSWTYTPDSNSDDTINELGAGDTLGDGFTIQSSDGTEKSVNVTIRGVNDAAVIGGTLAANLDDNTDSIGGTASVSDVDGEDSFNADTSTSSYGDFEIAENGDWSFDLNNDYSVVDQMQEGDEIDLTYTIEADDGTQSSVVITVTGANDDSIITGTTTGTIFEGVPTTSNYLGINDVDNDVAFTPDTIEGDHGTLTIEANGTWTYALDNTSDTVNGLTEGDTLGDTVTVYADDGNNVDIDITISGINDAAVFTGDVSAYMNEDTDTYSGTLNVSDVDGADSFTAETLEGDFGTLTIDANGAWTFDLNNDLDIVAGLSRDDTLGDGIDVEAADGTKREISMLITGVNDEPTLTGVGSDYIFTEDTQGSLDLSAVSITDVDTNDTQTLTLTVTGGTFTAPADGASVGDGVTATLTDAQTITLVGSAGDITSYLDTIGNVQYTGAENAEGDNAATLTVAVNDGNATVSESANVDITAVDDEAVVSGTFTGEVVEGDEGDGGRGTTASGTLSISDVDTTDNPSFADQAATAGDNAYGTFELTGGGWIYRLDQTAVQDLDADDIVSDTITYTASNDAEQQITITITGTADDAVITGTFSGSVSEQATSSGITTGTLSISDLDEDDTPTFADQGATRGDNGYGKFELTGDTWTYTLDRNAVQGQGAGSNLTDSITYEATDGSTQEITVTVVGANDTPSSPWLISTGVDENTNGAFVGTLNATDPEGDGVSFSVDDPRFKVVGDKLYLADDVALNHEELQELSIKVTASDGNTGRSAFLNITVNDLPDAIVNKPTDSNDMVMGGDGRDTLTGGAGNDTLDGGDGDDTILKDSNDDGQDIIVGGAGNDMVRAGGGDDFIVGDGASDGATRQSLTQNSDTSSDGADTIRGGTGDDTILGGGWDDDLIDDNGRYDDGEEIESGTEQNNIWAGAGNDVGVGSGGTDLIGGSSGDDKLVGLDGNDTLFGHMGDDLMLGGAGDDLAFNGSGADTVDGGAGDDTLWASAGDDQLTGGVGADTFCFGTVSGNDVVTDFNADEDTLDLSYRAFESLDDVFSGASETSVNGTSGVMLDFGGGESAFLAGLTLNELNSAQIII
ncbi:VCBS domain-containing protein [Kordiimonas sp.]|uniref:VCBS domain-containing protein n=1 Tax=Kordiimonas sp. TaxID=1970157 RepID=UPI003A8E9880